MTAPDRQTRYLGCLLGGALGDALGAPIEFMSLDQIRHQYGPEGLSEFTPAYGRLGAITDDTQMTLFTTEGMIRALNRGNDRGICNPAMVVHGAYQRWLATQGYPQNGLLYASAMPPEPTGWLIEQQFLHNRRAPGTTCISALRHCEYRKPAPNSSKGCGGVMRAAPAGFVWENEDPFEFGCRIAAITHGHPTGHLTAGVLAAVIAELREGADLAAALRTARERLRSEESNQETLHAIDVAGRLTEQPNPDATKVESLGQGWIAEEALAISLYCALVAQDFKHGLRLAVNHGGDSDSTGSITGNLLGAWWGVDALPGDWLEDLEGYDVIRTLAGDLCSHMESTRAEPRIEPTIDDRYPPW